MTNEAERAFKGAPLYTDGVNYVMIGLHPRAITSAAAVVAEVAEAFSAIIVDKDEVTLVISAGAFEVMEHRLPGARVSQHLRLITPDLELPPDLTGFMALIAGLLAEAHIPIIPIGAHVRDHILVPAFEIERALSLLKEHQEK